MLLLRFATELEDYGKVDQLPALEGKRMIMMMSPKKSPAKAAPAKPKEDKPKVKVEKKEDEEKSAE